MISLARKRKLLDTQNSLLKLFNKYFQVIPADTPEKLRECYRLRYEVYCKEGIIPGFNPDHYPEGLEYDQYDEHSAHSLLIHKPMERVAGTVRMILPVLSKHEAKFPIEEHAGSAFYENIISFEKLPRTHLGEISRLILSPDFRARKGENWQPYGVAKNPKYSLQQNERRQSNIFRQTPGCSGVPRRTFPHAVLGLFVAIVRMSFEHNLTYWYGGMEPACARFLRSFGINFTPISPIVEYYGPCKSYIGYIPDIMENIYRTNPQIWTLLTNNGTLFSAPEVTCDHLDASLSDREGED